MTDLSKLHPAFRGRLERLMAATGVTVRSGWRSSDEQAYLYNCYLSGACNNGNPANRPGESNHEAVPWDEPMALAADLEGDLATAHARAADFGLHFPIQAVEPWHVQPVEVRNAYYTGVPDLGGVDPTPVPDVSARRRPPAELRLSSQGAALIAEFEGFVPTVYRDPVGVETIGYGETKSDIIEAWRGREMPQEEAYRLLLDRVEADYAPAVRKVGTPLAQSEFDALCSFTYNLGVGIFDGSTIGLRLASADYAGVAEAFARYVNAGGLRLAGLVRRRAAEADLFRSEWGTARRLPVPIMEATMSAPVPFRPRPGGFEGMPCYDAEWVPSNGQPLGSGIEWRVNVHVQQAVPEPGRVAHFSAHGAATGGAGRWAVAGTCDGGETFEFQPATYGPIAVVSERSTSNKGLEQGKPVELVCSWHERIEPSGG